MDDDLNEEKIKHIVTRIPVLDEQTRYELQKLVLSLTMDVNVLQNIIRMTIDTLDQGERASMYMHTLTDYPKVTSPKIVVFTPTARHICAPPLATSAYTTFLILVT